MDKDQLTYVESQFSFGNLEGLKEQILNPIIDKGYRKNTINKDKIRDFEIVDIYGEFRFPS